MKSRLLVLIILSAVVFIGCSSDDITTQTNQNFELAPQGMYFPPIDGSSWETITAAQLKWNQNEIQNLYDYLEINNTKGFVVLKEGRIVMEKYFNGHNENAKWTWFSAAKSLTATFVGVAQAEGHIDINNKTSDYLGSNWSQLTTDKQDLITVKNHLNMTTGLTDNYGNNIAWICAMPNCLEYTADAGTRWAYHQGAFTLLQEMITKNTGMIFQAYCKEKIADKIGMNGNWTTIFGLNIYNSNTRGMARFGLLSLNKGAWNGKTIVSESYFNEMINSSQDLNKSFGYLWWLNGKGSYLSVGSQVVVQGSLIPNAPSDMFAALGANDQKIYVVPSQKLVIIRTGDSAGQAELGSSSFDNELWGKLNAIIN